MCLRIEVVIMNSLYWESYVQRMVLFVKYIFGCLWASQPTVLVLTFSFCFFNVHKKKKEWFCGSCNLRYAIRKIYFYLYSYLNNCGLQYFAMWHEIFCDEWSIPTLTPEFRPRNSRGLPTLVKSLKPPIKEWRWLVKQLTKTTKIPFTWWHGIGNGESYKTIRTNIIFSFLL